MEERWLRGRSLIRPRADFHFCCKTNEKPYILAHTRGQFLVTFWVTFGAHLGSLLGSLLGLILGHFWGSFWVTFWVTFWITFEASLECPEVPFKAHRKGASLPAQLPGCPEVPSGVHIRPPAPFAYGSSSMHRHSFESARSSSNKPKPATGSFASLSGVESIEFL